MIAAIVQARTGSTRLPEKVLAPIGGRPMLAHVLERAARATRVEQVVLATSVAPADDRIEALCHSLSVRCFRGSLDDVLDRYYRAALAVGATACVRITGDCPLIDPEVVDLVVSRFESGRYDYVSNTLVPTYPDGLDTEVFSFQALERAWREARRPSEREHVTPFITGQPGFRLGQVKHGVDLSHLRWTVDEPADLEFARAVFAMIREQSFGMQDVLELLARAPELSRINRGIGRNEGYRSSLEADDDSPR